jgi:ADP-L-glycero-D-manno-heptose 6-epimerase
MIVLTGAAGFIGSCFAAKLNAEGMKDLVLVDYFLSPEKQKNFRSKIHLHLVDRRAFSAWAKSNGSSITAIVHLGARTDTSLTDESVFDQLNFRYSQELWKLCTELQIPFIYASSAATYGDGALGFSDDHALQGQYQPLNAYARSKQAFDCWALEQTDTPNRWAGLKFFNVYGPNEYHKGRMASVVYHAYHQIKESNRIYLFQSHKPEYADGEQKRDFIYVKDVIEVVHFFLNQSAPSGIYNLGSGRASSFNELGHSLFQALELPPVIEYVPIPEEIRSNYQYFTEADISKLRAAGYDKPFYNLSDGIQDYVKHFLNTEEYF